MKIKNVSVKNAGMLSSFDFDCGITTLIEGDNEKGKSTLIKCLSYFFTGKVIDDFGVNETKVDGLIKNGCDGMTIEITTDTGETFLRELNNVYDRYGAITSHTGKYYARGKESKNLAIWQDELYDAFGFERFAKEFDELKIETDPLYAFSKMPSADLRKYITKLIGDVSYADVFALGGYDNLLKYQDSGLYRNNFEVLRKFLNDERLKGNKQLDVLNENIKRFRGCEKPDESILKNAYAELDKIAVEMSNIKNADNSKLNDMKHKLELMKMAHEQNKQSKLNDLNNQIKTLDIEKKYIIDNQATAIDNKLNPLRAELEAKKTLYDNAVYTKGTFNDQIDTLRYQLKNYKQMGNDIAKLKSDTAIKLIAIKNKEYQANITCPDCGATFPADADDYALWQEEKENDIKRLTDQMADCDDKVNQYADKCKKIVSDADAIKKEIAKIDANMMMLDERIKELIKAINDIKATPIDETSTSDIDKKIAQIKNLKLEVITSAYPSEINTLQAKIEALEEQNDEATGNMLLELEEQKAIMQSSVNNYNAELSLYNEKIKADDERTNLIKVINDIESELASVNNFITKWVGMINDKATQKLGIDFVMIEENLSNDGVKKVCYATKNGIPFRDLNTANKIMLGIKFIEAVKRIKVELGYRHNDMPILADQFEKFGKIEYIRQLTDEQLICTRVTADEKIKIERI